MKTENRDDLSKLLFKITAQVCKKSTSDTIRRYNPKRHDTHKKQVPGLTADLDVQHMPISTLNQFPVIVCGWTREWNSAGREKTGSHSLPTYSARVAFDISSFPSKMILDVWKVCGLSLKESCWQNDDSNRRTQYITCYIHAVLELYNPPCSNDSLKYRAKCNENRLDSGCSLVPPRGRTHAHFPNSGW